MKITIEIESDTVFSNVRKLKIMSHGRSNTSHYDTAVGASVLDEIKLALWVINDSFIAESVEYWEDRVKEASKEGDDDGK